MLALMQVSHELNGTHYNAFEYMQVLYIYQLAMTWTLLPYGLVSTHGHVRSYLHMLTLVLCDINQSLHIMILLL